MSLDANACQSCDVAPTATEIKNSPGLSAIAYRIGTHARFKAAMIEALKYQVHLRGLTTRSDDDPSIALLDGWAAVLDVLTFYQERIANEGYLLTATERRSILQLARSIGYELNPGVAASALLAFTLDTNEQAPREATIAIGAKVQSVPKQDESPQMFETIQTLNARAEWNTMKPVTREDHDPVKDERILYLEGTATNLQPGDGILLVGEERRSYYKSNVWDFRYVKSIKPVPSANPGEAYTEVELHHALGKPDSSSEVPHEPDVYAFRRRAALFGSNAPDWKFMPVSVRDSYHHSLQADELERAYRDKQYEAYATEMRKQYSGDDWPDMSLKKILGDDQNHILLDAIYPKIVPDDLDAKMPVEHWVVLARSDDSPPYELVELYNIERVTEESPQRFMLSGKVTCVWIRGEHLFAYFNTAVRKTTVFAESEKLTLAKYPVSTDIAAGTQSVKLQSAITPMEHGRTLILKGTDIDGNAFSEVVKVDNRDGTTTTKTCIIDLQTPLANNYTRASLEILGNVAEATHGETKNEVLGSGDGGSEFQNFQMKQKPLTFVPSTDASGSASTLVVNVNDVEWKEAPTLYGLGPKARRFITRRADDGTVTVQFGDGVTGARPPSGVENIKARYRVGIGLEALVDKDKLTTLLTRPLGVNAVTNPLPSGGAADPEPRDEARANAPFTVRTLDRIVSLLDFEDFARNFAGIGKARADWIWPGTRHIVLVTVAGPAGKVLDPKAEPYINLLPAMNAVREPFQPVSIEICTPLTFGLTARVLVLPEYDSDLVFEEIRAKLIKEFSFDKRAFAQQLKTSDIVAVIHSIAGVQAVDLDEPTISDGRTDRTIYPARWCKEQRKPLAAELLLIDPAMLELEVMQS